MTPTALDGYVSDLGALSEGDSAFGRTIQEDTRSGLFNIAKWESFDDTYRFELTRSATDLVVTLPQSNTFTVDFFFFSSTYGVKGFSGDLADSGTQITTSPYSIGALMAGTYDLIISGKFRSTGAPNAYTYEGGLDVTYAPIPAAAWLFVSALVGGGLLSRRRADVVDDTGALMPS
jgi:hypothetical protein